MANEKKLGKQEEENEKENLRCYEMLLPIVEKIPDSEIIASSMPLDDFNQEAENLHKWAIDDLPLMIEIGLDKSLYDDIPTRVKGLRQAMSYVNISDFEKEEYRLIWKNRSKEVQELRRILIRSFRFAYRNNASLLGHINKIASNESYPGMIQDLNDLSELGKRNPRELEIIKFDFNLLAKAASVSVEMSEVLAHKNAEKNNSKEINLRDKFFTYLKQAVKEVSDYGKYLFDIHHERRKGYVSAYLARARRKRKKNEESEENNNIPSDGE
ncbi:MAG: hypothetical protein JXR70_02040 [Spirochaetales bacterium]|nr:hypothetical protein [Spirochaetales bacterium]